MKKIVISVLTVLMLTLTACGGGASNGTQQAASDQQGESITADNGKEFAAHQHISQALSVDFYFAHPYSSWERGTNENTNGLIRQYLPKDRNLKNVSFQEEAMIMDRLNLRPRKCLDFRTPFEVFFDHHPVALAT